MFKFVSGVVSSDSNKYPVQISEQNTSNAPNLFKLAVHFLLAAKT